MFLTLDLDKVLIQNPFGLGVFPAICRLLRSAPNVTSYAPADGTERPEDTIMRLIRAKSERRTREGDWVGAYDWDAIVGEVCSDLGTCVQIDVGYLVRRYCRPGYIAVYHDAIRFLDSVLSDRHGAATSNGSRGRPPSWSTDAEGKGIRPSSIWWISNGFACYQLPVLKALCLERYFSGYFAPDTHGVVKPHAAIFEAAVHAAGEPASHGVHVGDHLTHDIAGARRAGMVAVWLDRCLPPVFHDSEPWDIPGSRLFRRYAEQRARSTYQAPWYGVTDDEVIPDAVISSLDQLPAVLRHFSHA